MTYLIDHNGIIRAKFDGDFASGLDAAIDRLVAEVPPPSQLNRAWPLLLGGGLLCVLVAAVRLWRNQLPGPVKI
jgi:hypothetical protein